MGYQFEREYDEDRDPVLVATPDDWDTPDIEPTRPMITIHKTVSGDGWYGSTEWGNCGTDGPVCKTAIAAYHAVLRAEVEADAYYSELNRLRAEGRVEFSFNPNETFDPKGGVLGTGSWRFIPNH